jgi:histidinol-phosphate aminotransferase
MKWQAPDHILSLTPYVPGKPMEEVEREYGIEDPVKLASNENPLGPSPRAVEAIKRTLSRLHRYPDGGGHDLSLKLARRLGLSPANIVIGNGSDDLLGMLACAFLQVGDEAVLPRPSFLMYDIAVRSMGGRAVSVPLKSLRIDLDAMLRRITPKTRIIFLCSPNNPTGTTIGAAAFERFISRVPPQVIVVVDEAYIEFVRDPQALRSFDFFSEERALVILRTFSKAYGLAGLRVGYGIMPADIAQLLNRVRQPFNVNSLAQAAALAALDDRAFLQQTTELVHKGLDFFYEALGREGIPHFPSEANFFLIDVGRDADAVFRAMLCRGVIVRSMSSYGHPHYIRVNVGIDAENRRFLEALKQVLATAPETP